MEFKSDDIFTFDEHGNITSPFVNREESDDYFQARMDTLTKLGCPQWVLDQLHEMRTTIVFQREMQNESKRASRDTQAIS